MDKHVSKQRAEQLAGTDDRLEVGNYMADYDMRECDNCGDYVKSDDSEIEWHDEHCHDFWQFCDEQCKEEFLDS